MTYAIITGAHFLPYFWYYNEKACAIAGGVISLGSFVLGMILEQNEMFYLPLGTSLCLMLLGIVILRSSKQTRIKNSRK